MAQLTTHKTDEGEWEVLVDGAKIGVAYKRGPREYAGDYTYVERGPGELRAWNGNTWQASTLREVLIELEEHHQGVFLEMRQKALARRQARLRMPGGSEVP